MALPEEPCGSCAIRARPLCGHAGRPHGTSAGIGHSANAARPRRRPEPIWSWTPAVLGPPDDRSRQCVGGANWRTIRLNRGQDGSLSLPDVGCCPYHQSKGVQGADRSCPPRYACPGLRPRPAGLVVASLRPGAFRAERGRHRMDHHRDRAVLFMTLPGLALFYGGLVRARNLLSVPMHCFSICCLVSVLWLALAYSLAFDQGNTVIGGFGRLSRRRHRNPRRHGARSRLLHVSDDLRDHHAGADRRCLSRAHLSGRAPVQRHPAALRSMPRSPTGSGAAAGSPRWA